MWPFIGLAAIACAVGIWRAQLAAREQVLEVTRRACKEQEMQLLDETVAQKAIRIVWHQGRLRVWRFYRFEYSVSGAERRNGEARMMDLHVYMLDFDPKPVPPRPPGNK